MQYKTIVLELLQQRPEIHDQLRKDRMLLPTLQRYASELKISHETWKDRLDRAKPGSDPSQLASEALEMAVRDTENRLLSELTPSENGPLSLDESITVIRRHTSPA